MAKTIRPQLKPYKGNLFDAIRIAHGLEDLDWGRSSIDQVALGLILNGIAGKIANKTLAKQVGESARQLVAESAQLAMR